MSDVRLHVLGSLEVLGADDEVVDVGGAQPRLVLAMLLAACGRIVPVDALIEGVWGDEVPDSAAGTLQSYISRLRRQLEPARPARGQSRILVWEPPGYRLDVTPEQVDFRRFERLADEGRERLRSGDATAARDRLVEAEKLWRGDAFAEFADHEFARGPATRLEERRLAAVEDRIEADLALGRHDAVVGELSELVSRHPLREGLWANFALALYRSGRQADALRVLADMRTTLLEELGVDPSPPLRELEQRILEQDPGLAAPSRPAPATQPAGIGTGPGAATGAAPERAAGVVAAPGIVGRQVELGQLVDALQEACAGQARFAVVEGEPGIGKTRLLEELVRVGEHAGAHGFWGRCYEGGAAPAFWPWLDVLRGLADEPALADPGLGQLLSPEAGAGAPATATDRFTLFEAIAATVERVAARSPLVLVVDDVQWADPASLELFEFLAGRLSGTRVLLAVSVRELDVSSSDAVVRALAALTRRPGSRRVHLRGLGVGDTAVLVEQAMGSTPSTSLARAVHDRADGNPFFVGELARLLLVSDGASNDDELVRRAAVPGGVRDVVRQRLARLPDATTEILQVSAVLGRDVELGVLSHAAGRDLERCLEDLEPAFATRLLTEIPDAPGSFRFAHALVREVVVDEVTPRQRAALHRRAAEAVVAVAGDTDDTAEIVAAHLWAAVALGGRREAAAALERAAEVAVRRFAYESAEDLLERAVQLRRTSGSEPADLEAELGAITQLLRVRRVQHGYRASMAEDLFDRARELVDRTGRTEPLHEFLWAEWAALATGGELDTAQRLADRLSELTAEADDPMLEASGHANQGIQCWHRGRMTEAAAHLDRALEIAFERHGLELPVFTPAGQQVEPMLLAVGFHVAVHEMVGDIDDGYERIAKLASAQQDPYGLCIAWGFEGFAGMVTRDAARAARGGRLALAHETSESFAFFGAAAGMYLAWGLGELGEPEQGVELFEEHLPRYEGLGIRTILPIHEANFALTLLRAGRLDDAGELLGQAQRVLADTGEWFTEPFVLMAEAELQHARGADDADVAATLSRAVERATSQGSHAVAARARELAGRLGVSLTS